ncbi:MBL fold metallo-hydrolase [Sphingomonas sp. BIUV-7]|uniref:MBL fold metallo-hydrolase n=1 Tax=Sphingomonas natans TaxID=3063330 RepID=A0ABT8YFI9_9SPHN|nr:MBL fold metallo-hydrolase [Sphingomonas sp. BIUV-7]MDO6416460.1 MBL fold metallo-hydrolase [Sphingomonas sp. BIUV-7]
MLTRRTMIGAGLAAALPWRVAGAPPAVPQIDRLQLTILADSNVSSFAQTVERPGLRILPPERAASSYQLTLRGEWGYSVLAEATAGTAPAHRLLIDFGYTPEGLAGNMAILGVDPATIEAMVLSHGHYDHFGGLPALLGRVKRGTPLYVGGEEAFCARIRGTAADGPSFGRLDRRDLNAAGIDVRISPASATVGGVACTTGRIPFVSPERPKVPTAMLPGDGCRRADLDPDRRDADVFVDDAVHELGTAFHMRGKGLVVIASCSHRGIINTVRAAQAVSGVDRVHAIVGGFHLVPPQTQAQTLDTLALMRALKPDYILPGHCTGEAFLAPAIAEMPDQVFRTVVGSRILFA